MPSFTSSLMNTAGTFVIGGILGVVIGRATLSSDDNFGFDIKPIVASDAKKKGIAEGDSENLEEKNPERWCVKPSDAACRTRNPIRDIVDELRKSAHWTTGKLLIDLSIGDPTIFSALPICEKAQEALKKIIDGGAKNGYPPSMGFWDARQAIARKYTEPTCPVAGSDVFLTHGCSEALSIAIASLVNPGENILLPNPGFSLYKTISDRYNLNPRFYTLNEKSDWEINMRYLEKQIDHDTKAIVVNNPSNPFGSVFSQDHLLKLVKLCTKYKIPIIADEMYGGLTWAAKQFTPVRSLVSRETPVPVISCGGISKSYLVPGWRVGWIVVSDLCKSMTKWKQGVTDLLKVTDGPNSLVQAALPEILEETPESFFSEVNETLKKNAEFLFNGLSKIPTLNPIRPQAAMYMMVEVELSKLHAIGSTTEFCKRLLQEKRVLCLPGEVFHAPGYFRMVIFSNLDLLKEAIDRIENFIKSI